MTTPEHYKYVFSNYSREEAIEFFGSRNIEELQLEKRRHDGGLETFNKKCIMWHLLDKSTGKVIGWCAFHTWYIDHDRAEIGYGLFDDIYKRQGYMSEALVPILEYGFTKMNLERVEAFTAPDNHASIALAEKFGFKYEGCLRKHYKVDGSAYDSNIYGLLKSEYNSITHES